MKQAMLIENDGYVVKNGEIHLLLGDNRKILFGSGGHVFVPFWIYYLDSSPANLNIRWRLPLNLIKEGARLIGYENGIGGIDAYFDFREYSPNRVMDENETFLIGELVEPVQIRTVSPQNAEAFHRIR